MQRCLQTTSRWTPSLISPNPRTSESDLPLVHPQTPNHPSPSACGCARMRTVTATHSLCRLSHSLLVLDVTPEGRPPSTIPPYAPVPHRIGHTVASADEDEPLPPTFPDKSGAQGDSLSLFPSTQPATQPGSPEYDCGSELDQSALDELTLIEGAAASRSNTSFLKTANLTHDRVFNPNLSSPTPSHSSRRVKAKKMKDGKLFFGRSK